MADGGRVRGPVQGVLEVEQEAGTVTCIDGKESRVCIEKIARARLKDVKYWARRTMRRFDLGGFLVLESSPGSFHVVFDRTVDWGENVRIMAWVALYVKRRCLDNWFKMQCIKQKPTLRVSAKHQSGKVKLSPRIVYWEGSQVNEISDFVEYRDFIKRVYSGGCVA